MEDPTPPVQTDEQPKAGPGAEEMSVDPISESSGARQPTKESTAAASKFGDGEQLAPMVDGSATMLGAIAKATGSSVVNAGDVGATPESGAAKLVAPKE